MNDNPSNETSDRGPFERQLFVPRRLLLAKFAGAAPLPGGRVAFRLDVPDMRLHWKFDIIATGAQGVPGWAILAGRVMAIWVSALADDQARGTFGIPVTDIEGTSAVPTPFPANTALGGYSLENPGTAASAIQGVITIPDNLNGAPGSLYLQAAYQPKVGHFYQPAEWQQIKALCGIELLTAPVSTS